MGSFSALLGSSVNAHVSTSGLTALLLSAAIAVVVAVTSAGGAVAQSRTMSDLLLETADCHKVGA